MPQEILYQWENEIATHLPSLNSWQVVNMALFSYGVVQAESSQQVQISRRLRAYGQRASLVRRLQRFLANPNLRVSEISRDWCYWIWTALGEPAELTL